MIQIRKGLIRVGSGVIVADWLVLYEFFFVGLCGWIESEVVDFMGD